ncbi:MAG TPA: hypothetical protein VLX44_14690 [Xanthobacteraceae bacterium]|nr:hypothetical protein [Xanthobacteraceae bacterium]
MSRHPIEPEILPPDPSRPEAMHGRPDPWSSTDVYTTHRIYVRRIGPLGIFLAALLIGTLVAVVFVILVGAFLVWIPVTILLFVAAVVIGLMRRYLMR